jgi:hypothetical protein
MIGSSALGVATGRTLRCLPDTKESVADVAGSDQVNRRGVV